MVNWNLREKVHEDEQMVKGQAIIYCGRGGEKGGLLYLGRGSQFF